MDLTVVALAFGTIFLVELPDKTFLATLILATRYRPILVWLGVAAAFAVQTTVAVALGQLATLLPAEVVRVASLVLFLAGAVLLIREGRSHGDDQDLPQTSPVGGWRAIGTSFLVLFAAEWGDLSQLLTLTLVARYNDAPSVFVGALAALLAVSGLAVVVGRTLLRFVPLQRLHYAGAAVCLGLAALTAVELIR